MKRIRFPFYFETKEHILCHTISEDCYLDENHVIGLPKYFPTNNFIEGGRVYKGKPYLDHLPTFQDSLERMRATNGSYLQYVERFGEELCVFNVDQDIIRIFDPQEMAKAIYKGEIQASDQIIADAKRIIDVAIECFGIDIKDIGIEGSILLGCYKKSSDVDMIIYGRESGLNVVDNFENLKKYPEIHLYDMSDIDLIFSRRYKYRSFTTNSELLDQEKRRTVGLINNRRFWMQPILFEDNPEQKHSNRKIYRTGIIEDVFEITDDHDAKFWPAFYEGKNDSHGSIQIECYDPIYMNQAAKGDKILVRGNLYMDNVTQKKSLIMGPWINTTQFMKKI